jgi:RNase P subunit RPR2
MKMNSEQDEMICGRCDVAMVPMKSTFSYLKREFKHTVLRCPICGQIYIPEDLAKGKMREVEAILEEK